MKGATETLTVLAVDDNPTDLVLLRRALERSPSWNIDFHGAASYAEAEGLLAGGSHYDLVFMDYRLGADDGVEGIRRLRASGYRFPLILLTGQGDERVAAASRRSGGSDYLCKDDLMTAALDDSVRFVLNEYRQQRRHSQALRDALTDGLTGLVIKDYLHRRADEEVQRAQRYGTPLACVMIDLDHFKSVNDVHGHLAGDEVLRQCAEVVRGSLRATDIAGRFGGEEICLILPQCTLDSAVVIAERIRRQVEELQISFRGRNIQVTLSAGVAAIDHEVCSADELIEAADTALYTAKRTGRNRVCQPVAKSTERPTGSLAGA